MSLKTISFGLNFHFPPILNESLQQKEERQVLLTRLLLIIKHLNLIYTKINKKIKENSILFELEIAPLVTANNKNPSFAVDSKTASENDAQSILNQKMDKNQEQLRARLYPLNFNLQLLLKEYVFM